MVKTFDLTMYSLIFCAVFVSLVFPISRLIGTSFAMLFVAFFSKWLGNRGFYLWVGLFLGVETIEIPSGYQLLYEYAYNVKEVVLGVVTLEELPPESIERFTWIQGNAGPIAVVLVVLVLVYTIAMNYLIMRFLIKILKKRKIWGYVPYG